jgi:hypothetical protein
MRNKMELEKLISVLCALCEHETKHSATARENLPHKIYRIIRALTILTSKL